MTAKDPEPLARSLAKAASALFTPQSVQITSDMIVIAKGSAVTATQADVTARAEIQAFLGPLPAGFPKVVKGTEHPWLDPQTEYLAIGACFPREADDAVEYLRTVYPAAEVVPYKGPPGKDACPKFGDWYSRNASEIKLKDKRTIRYYYRRKDAQYEDDKTGTMAELLVTLWDKTGALQDWLTQKFAYPVNFDAEHPPDTWILDSPSLPGDVKSCGFGATETKTSFTFFRTCSLGADVMCAGGYAEKEWRFSASKNKLKVTSKGEVRACRPGATSTDDEHTE